MKTSHILASMILLALPAFAEKPKPNILPIAVDDLNDWVGVHGGHPQAETPNIDRLAKTSMVFRNASCVGPVCGPSRSALLSGFKGNHSVMSEKWHYIVYSDGTEESYSMEKDPMEWTNLANDKSPELEQVKAHLRTFLPKNEIDSLPQSGKESASQKTPDPTLKPKRILAELK